MPDQPPSISELSTGVVRPYVPEEMRGDLPVAQEMSRAATDFNRAFSGDFSQGANRKHNGLDRETKANLDELMAQMRRDRPKPAMVINLHPFELQFNADNFLLRGHIIPACLPSMPYNYKSIRGWRHDGGSYNESGSRKFKAILPIDVAGQFAREFNKIETFGPGVLIYRGDDHPDKVGDVETYDQMGRAITRDAQGVDYDEEDRQIAVMVKQPVFAKFADLLKDLRKKRNDFYMTRVQQADQWAIKDNGKFSSWIQPSHRLMAEVLFHEGIIDKVPDWKMSTKFDKGLAADNCSSCQRPVQKKAYRCENCGNILDALAAFKDGFIEFEHGKIALLDDDAFAEAKKIHSERMKTLTKRGLLKEPKESKESKKS